MKTEPTSRRSTRQAIRISMLTIVVSLFVSIIASSCSGGSSYASATFTALSSTMTTARHSHAQVTLQNGDVLITGGTSTFYPTAVLDTVEIFNPATNTFTAISNKMQTARAGHTATLLPDGKVLLTGGYDSNGIGLNTAEIFDPATQSFLAVPGTMSMPRGHHAAVLLRNGTVLVMMDGSSADVFNPATNTFTSLSFGVNSPPWQPRYFTASLLPNDKVLIAGGSSIVGSVDTAGIFDPITGIFTAMDSRMIGRRLGHSAVTLSNRSILITGGSVSDVCMICVSTTRMDAEIFDPYTYNFSSVGSYMTTYRSGHASSLLADGSVLITGGFGLVSFDPLSFSDSAAVLDSAEKYGPQH